MTFPRGGQGKLLLNNSCRVHHWRVTCPEVRGGITSKMKEELNNGNEPSTWLIPDCPFFSAGYRTSLWDSSASFKKPSVFLTPGLTLKQHQKRSTKDHTKTKTTQNDREFTQTESSGAKNRLGFRIFPQILSVRPWINFHVLSKRIFF